MNIKVIGTGCEKCDQLYANVQEALKITGRVAEVEKIEDLMEIVKLEDDSFQVTQEELQMYDAIASGWEFDAAYALGINLSPMDYKTNGLGETLNERSVNYGNKNDPLLDPVRSAQYLLNLLDNENKVQLEKVSEGDKVFVKITFPEDGTVWQS